MEAKILNTDKLTLVGIKINTSLSENNTPALWKKFMSKVSEIPNRANQNYYSVQIYPQDTSMDNFTPITVFEKWAAIAVNNLTNLPEEMEYLVIEQGKYAVFKHKGIAADFFRTSQYIYSTWLPSSGFLLDNRPHFEVMGPNYKGPNDPDAEEDVYIPIKS